MLVRSAIHEYLIRVAPRLTHIYLYCVVAIALFAIIAAKRKQVTHVAMVAVFAQQKCLLWGLPHRLHETLSTLRLERIK